MKEENKFELIEKYLDGSLSETERSDFEKHLSKDKNLASEVDFQRNIESVLAHGPEDDLRANLERLDKKYSKPPGRSGKMIFYGIGLAVLVGLCWWLMQSSGTDNAAEISNDPVEESVSETETEEESPEEPITTESVQPGNYIEETSAPGTTSLPQKKSETPKQPEKTTPPKKSEPRPIAGNFEPNPFLESRLSSLRSDDFTVEKPTSGKAFSLTDGKIDFNLEGIFKSKESPEERGITLHIFSNKQKDYEEFKPTLSKELVFEKTDEGFEFALTESIDLKEGLYYFQIEDEDAEVLYLGKFLVRNR